VLIEKILQVADLQLDNTKVLNSELVEAIANFYNVDWEPKGLLTVTDWDTYEAMLDIGLSAPNKGKVELPNDLLQKLCRLSKLALAIIPIPVEQAPKKVWGIGFVAGVKGSEQMCELQHEGLPAKLASNGNLCFYPTHFYSSSFITDLVK
jgi:hypothetical protein